MLGSGVLTTLEGRPYSVIKPSLDPLNLDPILPHQAHDLLRNLPATHIRILLLVVMSRETVEIVDQIRHLGPIDLDLPRLRLPMRREYYNGLGLHFGGDFFSDLLELLVGWVIDLVHYVGLLRA